jgi:hypothetical protein
VCAAALKQPVQGKPFVYFFLAKTLYRRKKIAKPAGLGLDGTFLNRELFCVAHRFSCVSGNCMGGCTDVRLKLCRCGF